MRSVPALAGTITPQRAPSWPKVSEVAVGADIMVQAIDFIEFSSAFFVIVLSQKRMDTCLGITTQHFYTKLST
jgi:hypothetical protein